VRFGAGARADVEPAAGTVLDHEWLAVFPLQLVGQEAGKNVAAASGCERNDDSHRSCRPALRRRWLRR
jgi:hypothetical protein